MGTLVTSMGENKTVLAQLQKAIMDPLERTAVSMLRRFFEGGQQGVDFDTTFCMNLGPLLSYPSLGAGIGIGRAFGYPALIRNDARNRWANTPPEEKEQLLFGD